MNSKNVLLIKSSNEFINKEDNLHTKESLVPSLGLAMIATSLKEKGFIPKILDLRLQHRNITDVIEYIKKEKPLFVGMGAFTDEVIQSAECGKIIKSEFPEIPIIIGGSHATLIPKETLEEFKCFDIVVIGEGEEIICELANNLYNKIDLKKLENLAFREKERIIVNINQERFIKDLNTLPFPSWNLFELEYYNKIFVVSSSRGCPYKCYFL